MRKRTQPPVFGELKRQPFLKRRARIGEIFQQRQPGLRSRRQIFDLHAVAQRSVRRCRSGAVTRFAENFARKNRLPAKAEINNASNSANSW